MKPDSLGRSGKANLYLGFCAIEVSLTLYYQVLGPNLLRREMKLFVIKVITNWCCCGHC